MAGIALPPKRMFGSKDPKFIQERRGGLQEYLRTIVNNLRGVAEFQQHYCSADLRAFLCYDKKQFGMASNSRGEPIDPSSNPSQFASVPTAGGAAGDAAEGEAAPAPAPGAMQVPVTAKSRRHRRRQMRKGAAAAAAGALPTVGPTSLASTAPAPVAAPGVSVPSAAGGGDPMLALPAPAL